jgi:hypothetical protein
MTRNTTKETIEEIRKNISRTSVIAIAVSEYEHLSYLDGPTLDLDMVREIFTENSSVSLFQDQFYGLLNPTTYDFREIITNYSMGRSARGDILVLYFSGHGAVIGATDFGFCLRDTATRKDGSGILALSVVSFIDVVQTLSAADVLPIFIIDACFSSSTAPQGSSSVSSAMQDSLHRYHAGSYGLLASSSPDDLSFDSGFGGLFTRALHSIVINGLEDDVGRHLPLLTLSDLSSPLQSYLAEAGYPLPRSYLGPDLPRTPIAKNAKFQPNSETFTPYMKNIVGYLWNNNNPKEASISEFINLGPGAYANHSKLSYPPWELLEDGSSNSVRRLTERGKKFAKGERQIPRRIIKDPISWEWVADPDTDLIFISDI